MKDDENNPPVWIRGGGTDGRLDVAFLYFHQDH